MYRLLVVVGGAALLLGSLVPPHPSLRGQEPKAKTMTIRWFGQSFFQVEDSAGRKFAFDPHAIPAFGRATVRADFAIVTHPHDDHALIEMIDTGKKDARLPEADVYRGVTETRTGKQDWKVIDEKRGTTRIRTVATYHDTQNGLQRGKNSVFVVEVDGLVICHLGDLGHELTDAQVKAIGKVDVLMVPVGGIYTINGEQAQAVVKQLKPRLYVLPMHYGVPGYDDLAGPEEFLDGVPKDRVKKLPATNELTFPIDAKADAPTVVLLGWKKEEPPPAPPKK
ncbi:MBL fold metallo-hydrolase [Frigoriglobus tundricola]|uniref:Zn-dependent hydrolases of the metallo-beta-lactamase superfamily n=1 Tax=Frigoriglobus tundricola TaxID=2774151 RepID=A0A6M5YR58_9BACT|nr:MBL fold metallo-hydrolase [Frigoriglobus tundricola]QJW95482.1 Zn-dependent hydrolases of the metallo-beta-lactamase superfamily [Frigoriglobus tundricola]